MRTSFPTILILLVLGTLAPLTTQAGVVIGWANVQWPPTYDGSSCSGAQIYGQAWIDGVTSLPGATPGLVAEVGFGTPGTTPDNSWSWFPAVFNVDVGNNDEYKYGLSFSLPVGVLHYVYRYSYNGGDWFYADLDGPFNAVGPAPNPGVATITESCGVVAVEASNWSNVKVLFLR